MKLTVNDNNAIQLEKIFTPITLMTNDGEEMIICMRDTGFEFTYQGKNYSAKQGRVEELSTESNNEESITDKPHQRSIKQKCMTDCMIQASCASFKTPQCNSTCAFFYN